MALHGNEAARKAIKQYELYAGAPSGTGAASRSCTGLQVRGSSRGTRATRAFAFFSESAVSVALWMCYVAVS